jgi:hypothetical protein
LSVSGDHDKRKAYGDEGAGPGPAGGASRLPDELRALGRSLDPPGGAGSESMVERVLEQILAERLPVPVVEPFGTGERLRAARRWTRARWRSLTAVLCGLLAVFALTPPVRAAVLDWFDFGGVEVRYDPSAVPSAGVEVPGCGRSLSLSQAERRAGFEPLIPQALGTPDAVAVTTDRRNRPLMSLCWRERSHVIRLDEFAASLDTTFTKTVREQPQWVDLGAAPSVNGMADPALWFPRPHVLSFWLVGADGDRFEHEERTAGPTLLWTRGAGTKEVTLRLEGVDSKGRAVEIAKSVGP